MLLKKNQHIIWKTLLHYVIRKTLKRLGATTSQGRKQSCKYTALTFFTIRNKDWSERSSTLLMNSNLNYYESTGCGAQPRCRAINVTWDFRGLVIGVWSIWGTDSAGHRLGRGRVFGRMFRGAEFTLRRRRVFACETGHWGGGWGADLDTSRRDWADTVQPAILIKISMQINIVLLK